MKDNHLQKIGSRILSEFNDLKRTVESASKELDINLDTLKKIISGDCEIKTVYELLFKMGETYPIDISDMFLLKDDCTDGVKIKKHTESIQSTRIFDRKDKNNNLTPYYEYRDTAMSRLSPFKPEWIRVLRAVNDSNPDNPDVAYNNGHLMHQMTFFIGPINYYWKDENGKSYCQEFNTGDSNYITPYCPHTFASRDKTKDTIIIAVTFGADIRRNLKEIYWMGEERIKKYIELGKHSLNSIPSTNEHTNLKSSGIKDSHNNDYDYNDSSCRIKNLMDPSPLKIAKGSNIEVLGLDKTKNFETPYHSYIFNYGETSLYLYSSYNGKITKTLIEPNDSMYIQPFVEYSFKNIEDNISKLVAIEVATSMNDCTKLELSFLSQDNRLTQETKKWF